jgi:alcohol dehydrogenase class IV
MVGSFQFARLPGIIFRCGAASILPALIARYGKRVVLVTGKSSFCSSVNYAELLAGLDEKGIDYKLVVIEGEPSSEDIDQAVQRFAGEDIQLVAGIGGGSVLDAGKAVSAMAGRRESVSEFLEGVGTKEHPGTKLHYIAVPTTSGTGSEATKNAVISKVGKDGFKRSLRHDIFVPDIALVDPELTISCPKEITAASGMDCLTQLVEAYLSDKASAYTDALALEGIKAVKSSLIRCYKVGSDLEARSGMSFAALTSGICLANAGLGAVHGFASSVGGLYNIPHGIICGTLMGAANEVNVRELRKSKNGSGALKKYAILGGIFVEAKGKSADYYIDGFLQYLHDISSELNLPGLKAAGIDEADLMKICSETDCKNNPVKLNTERLFEIISARYF